VTAPLVVALVLVAALVGVAGRASEARARGTPGVGAEVKADGSVAGVSMVLESTAVAGLVVWMAGPRAEGASAAAAVAVAGNHREERAAAVEAACWVETTVVTLGWVVGLAWAAVVVEEEGRRVAARAAAASEADTMEEARDLAAAPERVGRRVGVAGTRSTPPRIARTRPWATCNSCPHPS